MENMNTHYVGNINNISLFYTGNISVYSSGKY